MKDKVIDFNTKKEITLTLEEHESDEMLDEKLKEFLDIYDPSEPLTTILMESVDHTNTKYMINLGCVDEGEHYYMLAYATDDSIELLLEGETQTPDIATVLAQIIDKQAKLIDIDDELIEMYSVISNDLLAKISSDPDSIEALVAYVAIEATHYQHKTRKQSE